MSNMKMIRYIKEKRRRDALGGMLGKKLSVAVCRVVITAMVLTTFLPANIYAAAGSNSAGKSAPDTYAGGSSHSASKVSKKMDATSEWEFSIDQGILKKYNGDGGEVVIPNTVTIIDSTAFTDNENVTKVTIPGSVMEIKWDAFKNCRELKEIVFLDGNEIKLRVNSFVNCKKLEKVTIPAHAKYVVGNVFKGCTSLKEIKVDSRNNIYHEKDGVLFGPVSVDNDPENFIPGKLKVQIYPAGKKGTYNIPSKVDGIDVVHVFAGAFDGAKGLTAVTIPASIERLSGFCFRGTGIKSIVIPETVKEVGSSNFEDCKDLREVKLPDHLAILEYSLFKGCEKLTDFNWPKSLKIIRKAVFEGCDSINSIFVPPTVAKIEVGAFTNMKNLTRLAIPAQITGAFDYNPVEKPNQNLKIYVEEGSYADLWLKKAEMAWEIRKFRTPLPKLRSESDIPKEVTYIGEPVYGVAMKGIFSMGTSPKVEEEFEGAKYDAIKAINGIGNIRLLNIALAPKGTSAPEKMIMQIKVPEEFNKSAIKVYKFEGDTPVEVLKTYDPNSGDVIMMNAKIGYYALADISILPKKLTLNKNNVDIKVGETTTLRGNIEPDNTTNKRIKWESDNKRIAKVDNNGTIFAQRPGKAVIKASTINGIQAECTVNVKGKNQNDKYFEIENGLLKRYNGPGGAVTIPDSVVKIKPEALKGNKRITELVIPASVTEIGYSAFQNMPRLESVEFKAGGSGLKIQLNSFANCEKLSKLEFPAHADKIVGNVQKGCISLKSIGLAAGNKNYVEQDGIIYHKLGVNDGESNPENIKGYCLQMYPAGREGVFTFPETIKGEPLTKTWPGAMNGSKYLTGVNISKNLELLGSGTFEASGLRSVVIPETVKNINQGSMFQKCKDLESAVIKAPMNDYGADLCFSMFEGCSSLKSVSLPDSFQTVGMYWFRGCESLEYLRLPDSTNKISYNAFDGCKSLTRLVLPGGLNHIESEFVFQKVGPDFKLLVKAGSYAEKYAQKNKVKYETYTDNEDLENKVSQPIKRTVSDRKSGISINGMIPLTMQLNVEKSGTHAKEATIADKGNKVFYTVAFVPNKQISQGTLTIPVGKEFDSKTAKLWKLNGETFIKTNATLSHIDDGNGYIVPLKDFSSAIYAVSDERLLPTKISFKPSSISMKKGEIKQLKPVAFPEGASVEGGKWESGNELVAKVSQKGQVFIVGEGETDITFTAINGVKGSCHIKTSEGESIVDSWLELSKMDFTIEKGKNIVITAKFFPEGFEDKIVKWEIEGNPAYGLKIAKLSDETDNSVNVIASKEGKVTLKAKSEKGLTAKSEITVVEEPAKGIVIQAGRGKTYQSSISPSVKTGESKKFKIKALDGGDMGKLSASVSDSSKADATIDKNSLSVQGKEKGYVNVTVTSSRGFKDTLKIKVVEDDTAVKKLTFDKESYEVEAGKTIEIKLVSKPDTHVLDYFADLRSVDTNLSDDLKKVRIDLDRDNNKLKITGLEPTGRDDVMILASLYKDRVDESSDFGDVSPSAYIKVTPGTVTKAASMKLTAPGDKHVIAIDEDLKLTPVFEPAGAIGENVEFKVDPKNSPVARVTEDGTVIPTDEGNVKIVATTESGLKAHYDLKVTKPVVEISKVNLTLANSTIKVEERTMINVDVEPAGASADQVELSVEKPDIAKIEEGEFIRGLKAGETKIFAKVAGVVKGEIALKVIERPAMPTAMEMTEKTLTLKKGESHKLNVKLTPENAGISDEIWKSSNSKVATVDNNGNVVAKAAGFTDITCSFKGLTATCELKVTEDGVVPARSMQFEKSEYVIEKGSEEVINVTFKAENEADNDKVTDLVGSSGWSVKPSGVIGMPFVDKKDRSFKAVARQLGECEVTAVSKGGLEAKATIKVVAPKAKGLEISKNGGKALFIGDGERIFKLKDSGSGNYDSDFGELSTEVKGAGEASAVIDGNKLKVSGIKPGKITVTVISSYGFKDSINLKVREGEGKEITEIKFKENEISIPVGTAVKLPETVSKPEGAFDPETDLGSVVVDEEYIDVLADGSVIGKKVTKKDLPTEIIYTVSSDRGKYDSEDGYPKATLKVKIVENGGGVYVPVNKITVSVKDAKPEFGVDEEVQLTVAFEPENATNKSVSYEVLKDTKDVATVDENGIVRARKTGTVKVVAVQGDIKSEPVEIKFVKKKILVTDIEVSVDKALIEVGKTAQITAKVLPEDAEDGQISYESLKPEIAEVDASGKVTAKKAGEAEIKVKAGAIEKTVKITVKEKPAPGPGPTPGPGPSPNPNPNPGVNPSPGSGENPKDKDKNDNKDGKNQDKDGQLISPNIKFTDVKAGAWYEKAVGYVMSKGIMNGTGESKFVPSGKTSRAMFAAMLYRLEKSPKVLKNNEFVDVQAGKWYTDAVSWITENNIAKGISDYEFAPEKEISREQLAEMMYKYAKFKKINVDSKKDLSSFADAPEISEWAKDGMSWMVAEGILQGVKGNKLDPKGKATRAEIAVIMQRFAEKYKLL